MPDPALRYRTGTKSVNGHPHHYTLYVQHGDTPASTDTYIGSAPTPFWARQLAELLTGGISSVLRGDWNWMDHGRLVFSALPDDPFEDFIFAAITPEWARRIVATLRGED
jgi:hypothetical protein